MDKYYFIEVQTFKSINKMGLELGQFVYKQYDQTVVHNDSMYTIAAEIKDKMEELQQKFPRCKGFKYDQKIFREKYDDVWRISVKPDNPYNDNYVFILTTKFIRRNRFDLNVI